MARVLAASACGAVVALGLTKLLRGKGAEARQVPPPVETKAIDGKAIAAEVRGEIKKYAAELKAAHNITPGLAVILVGSRKDSQSYVRNKKKAAEEVGFHTVDIVLPETVSQQELLSELEKLNADPEVHSILVQLPLPEHIDSALVLSKIRVDKDADGFSAENVGNLCMKGGFPPLAVPCTPAGCVELLQRSNVEVAGKNVVVLGRSNIVGMPVSQILQSMDATVTVCHSRTKDMLSYLRNADIVIAALGKAEYVRGEWLKPGCVVIDVGINAVDDATKKAGYRLVGDVNFAEAQGVASQITPVPGGVGPMTIAMLLKNTLNLARHSIHLPRIPLRRQVSPAAAAAPAEAAPAAGAQGGMELPKNEDLTVVMVCKDAESIWKAPEQAEAIRRKVQELTKSKMPPPLTLETGNDPAVSVVSLETKQVLCSAASTAELLTILSAASTSATQAPTNGHVKLPKGQLAVVAGCNGDIWEAAIQAGRLREKIKELSGMTSLPPLVVDREKHDVSVVKMGKDVAHGEVICSGPGLAEVLAALFHLEAFQRARELQSEKVKVPPRKRRVSVTFESRPFGMTPAKDEGGDTLGYVVDKVNHNDPSKPAARLGVKPGWVVVHRQLSVASNDFVIVTGEIGREGTCLRDDFRNCPFAPKRCAHDIESKVVIRMSADQWDHVACKSHRFLAVNAELRGTMLDTTMIGSGIMASPETRMSDGTSDTVACEIFSGGYSGWSQAMRCLTRNGFPFNHKLAVDHDLHAMEAFMKSHGFVDSLGPERFDWGRTALPNSLFICADAMLHGWNHMFSNTAYDVMVLSPPCPPWSFASLQQGLLKEEGRLTLHGWGLAGLLKPKVVVMEMVNGMKDHCHWRLIREMILWLGYSIRFARNCQLSEIAPQNRERLIVIATLDEAQLFPHLPAAWPCTQRQTLESYMCIMNLVEPWLSQCTLTNDLLSIYLDPMMLPKSMDQRGKNIKRSKHDVEQYRIKHPHGVFGCIMSNYSYGHLLPDVTLKHAGLFGTLIALPNALRFLSVPEILILQTTLESCWLPDNHRICIKLLGNSIATPHAMLGLVNALAFLNEEIACDDIRELMVRMLSKRMTSRNIRWERKLGGFEFSLEEDTLIPTQLIHPERSISVKSPLDVIVFHAECGTNVNAALIALLGDSMPSDMSLLPAGDLNARVALQKQMVVGEHDIQLFASVPCALHVPSNAFSTGQNQSDLIVVLTRKGPYVIRRDHGMTIQDVITIVDHSFEIRCTHLVGMLGERHPKLMICPDAVISLDVEGAHDELDILDFLSVKVGDCGISFNAPFGVLRDFWDVLYKTAMTEIINAMGWILVTDFRDVIDANVNSLQLVRKPGSLALPRDDLIYCIAIHLYLIKIKTWLVVGERPAVRCKLKLLHVWIWDSLIDPDRSLQDFEKAWIRITEFLQIDKPWRFVCQGRAINPQWPISGFVEMSESGTPEIVVYMNLGLKGGGPGPIRLKTHAEATYSENFQDMAHMEASNFESALAVALRMIVKADKPAPRYDITRFLQIETVCKDGFLRMNCDFQTLREFYCLMMDIGMEEMLKKCGWVMFCSIRSFDEPMSAEIVFVNIPDKRAVTMDLLKAILRSVLVILGMPTPTDNPDDVVLKMKLWGIVIFNARLPRMFPMQEIMDIWDQACTVISEHMEVRLVSHAGVVNPDFALKHYSKCGESDVSTAVMTFVGSLRGGGPAEKPPAHFQEFNIQQKNGLATFLLSQGADLKESLGFIDSILKGAGGGAVASIMGQKRAAKKWEGLTQLAQALHIPLPQIAQKLQKAKNKAQMKFQAQMRSVPANIPVENLLLKEGYLKNQDDTNCHQLSKMTPNGSGVYLMRFDDAKEWIERDVVLSQDELAAIVIGKCLHDDSSKCNRLQLPVCLGQEPLILQACLHQLGAKHVKWESQDENEIPSNDTQVMCITAVKQEIASETWDALLQAPVKVMTSLLGDEVADISFVAPPWGRSYQSNSKRTSPENASTVQFHCRIQKSDSRAFLRASGNAGVYTCPKTESKQISQDYMVVWTKMSNVELAVSLSQCENHMGVVRSFKGDNNAKGIRFTKHDFPAAFAKLRPGEDPPSQIAANHFFKVEPTPVGTTAEQMQAWINTHGWKAKPIRPMNASAWLCATESKFDDIFQQWNNSPVLIKWVQQKRDFQPVVLAGNMNRILRATGTESVPQTAVENGMLQTDPWATWMKNHGTTGLAGSNSQQRGGPSISAFTQPPRKLESPIEDKFQRQDEQLQQMRDATEKEIKTLKDGMMKLEKIVDGQKMQIERNVETTAAEFRSLRADTSAQFQAMAEMFKDSLSNAIQAHDGAMNAQFGELKALIASTPTRLKALPLNSHGYPDTSDQLNSAHVEWNCILSAAGYGHSWKSWILSFDAIVALPTGLPTLEFLLDVDQITEHDCVHACRAEAKFRSDRFKAHVHIDQADDFCKTTYRLVRAKSTETLSEVPVKWQIPATLMRSRVGKTALKLSVFREIPSHARLFFDDAELVFLGQVGSVVQFQHKNGTLPSHGTVFVCFTAVTAVEIASEFSDFWTPMWLRDERKDQFQSDNWVDFDNLLDSVQLPDIPLINYPLQDVKIWMKLIRKLPAGKAVGPCGWSNDEIKLLPEVCIADLVQIFSRVLKVGFGPGMMMAKTVLLSKIPLPLNMNHARPITILSCLYRLLGKFIFRFTADTWKDHFSFDISGGLPGRGVKELAFIQKRAIEQALHSGETLGGYSLDLIKAYNTFGRYITGRVMCRLGMPQEIIQAWLSSLDLMVRYPTIQGCVTAGIPSTTGVPEGCSISVLSMLATSCLFRCFLANESIRPFAYADNWSWMSKQQRAHFCAYQQVLRLTCTMKLQIDHSKSWHWGTKKSFRDFCENLSLLHPQNDVTIQIKTTVKDLGERVNYNRSVSLGFIKEKVDEAISRMHRIEWIPSTLQLKARLIQSAVWPLALYSADTTFIGLHHFTSLRRAALNCLAGKWHNASPIVACTFLSKFLIDPMLYTILQCARIVRRIASVKPELALETVRFAAEWNGNKPFGPATSLKQYIKQAAWYLSQDGTISGPDYLSCNLCMDSTKKICKTLKLMWNCHILELVDRKGMGEFHIDVSIFHKVFSKFCDSDQNILKLNIVGGFQTNSQKARWDENTKDECELCGESDTREHRLLHCAPLQEVRQESNEACETLRETRKEWLYMPMPRLHDQVTLLSTFLQTVRPPETVAPRNCDLTFMRFYTDGGAKYPTLPDARIATWAVVQDVSVNESHLRKTADFLFLEPPQFPLFYVAAVGIVPGEQTVARAELFAVVTAAKKVHMCDPIPQTEFVTDAAYVCRVVDVIESGLFQPYLHKFANGDLVQELANLWRKDRFRMTKVKSHRSFDSAKDLMDLWHIAGNMCADNAATAAYRAIPSDVRKLADDIFAHSQREELMLHNHFQFLCKFNRCRCQILDAKKADKPVDNCLVPRRDLAQQGGLFDQRLMGLDACNALAEFSPENYVHRPSVHVEDDIFHCCLQGANIAKTFKSWCELLRWPSDLVHEYDGKSKGDWGISWFELLVSFYLSTGLRCPIKTGGAGALTDYIAYDHDSAKLLPDSKRSVALQILCFRNLWQNVATILQFDVAFVAGEDVQGRSLEDVQQLTKEAALPVTIDFEVPVVVKEKQENTSEKNRSKSAPQQPRPPPQPTRESRERTETQRLQALLRTGVQRLTLDSEEKLPATVFIFSRRRVEALAAEMPNLDVCTNEEKSKVNSRLILGHRVRLFVLGPFWLGPGLSVMGRRDREEKGGGGGDRGRSDSRGASEYEYYSDYYSESRSRSRDRRRDRGRGRDRRRDRDRGRRRGDRSRRTRKGDWRDDMEEFIRKNALDKRTEDALWQLSKTIALTVMGMDGGRNTFLLEGVRNPDAVVMSRIRIAQGKQSRR
eukprot:s320_g22.t1